MTVMTSTHLNFTGNARAALEFYASVFGGQVVVVTYGDFGMPPELPDAAKVVWGQVAADNGFRIMAYDVPGAADAAGAPAGSPASTRRENGTTITSSPFFVSVRGDSVEELEKLWAALADGATVIEPYGPAQWAPAFGMLTDQFGVSWILDVAAS